jgi:hypothetical protein
VRLGCLLSKVFTRQYLCTGKILADPEFLAGKTDTGFIERFLAANKELSAQAKS